MIRKATLLFATAAVAVLASCGGKQPARLEPAEELRDRLTTAQAEGRTLFGHQDDPVYGHTWVGDSGRSDVLETCGSYPAVMSWDLGRIELGDSLNIDGVPFSRMRAEAQAHHARGGINAYSWHLWDPVNGGDSWNITDSTVVSQMVHDPAVREAFVNQLRAAARFFASLTDAEGRKIGVIFRPWHEHTGGWFWWGEPLCSVDDYKELWRITRETMEAEGADNLLYAYSPDRVKSAGQFAERYPGDSLVDIIGTDIYHYGGAEGAQSYMADVDKQLTIAREFADRHGKLTAFTETGSEGIPMDDWWTSVLLPLLKRNPVSYVVVWRNAHDKPGHFYGPWPGHPSADDFRQFAADSCIVMVK